jgi:hypothetical protein
LCGSAAALACQPVTGSAHPIEVANELFISVQTARLAEFEKAEDLPDGEF